MAKVTVELLDAIQGAFNRRDVDAILDYFTDDVEWLMARGPEAKDGRRLKGKTAIGDVLRARFEVFPDMRWEEMSHFIDGDRAASEWVVRGTNRRTGEKLELLGCDLWTFRDGKVVKKDTYWKYVG
jgi:taurine dehydrogenase small subunit